MKPQEKMELASYTIFLILAKLEPNERAYIINTLIPLTFCGECSDYITDCPHNREEQ